MKEEKLENVFVDFSGEFQRQNILLKITLLLISIFFVISVVLGQLSKFYIGFLDVPFMAKRHSPEKICYWGMMSILQNKGNSLVVAKSLLEQIEKRDITFSFNLKDSSPYELKMTAPKLCQITLEDRVDLIGFSVKLKEDSSYWFNYKVVDFDEFSIKKRDQSRGKR